MATLGTPFRRPRGEDFNIFSALDDSDDYGVVDNSDDAAALVTSPTVQLSPRREPVLKDLAGSNGASRQSLEDLAAQFQDFHIVTPRKKINKTRGLKPRPTVDQSTFGYPSEEQENSKPVETGPEALEGSPEQSLLNQRDIDRLPSDSTQLAKHQAGQFEFVLTLPAVTTAPEDDSAGDTSTSEEQQDVTTIQFGCNLVRADGICEIAKHEKPESSATYTLIATPIDCSGKTTPKSEEPVAETIEDMATTAVTQVDETLLPSKTMSSTLVHQISYPQSPHTEEPHTEEPHAEKPHAPNPVAEEKLTGEAAAEETAALEIPMQPQEAQMTHGVGLERMPGLVPSTEDITEQEHTTHDSHDKGSRRDSVAKGSPSVHHLSQQNQGRQLAAARRHSARRTETFSEDTDDAIDEIMSLHPAPSPSSRIEDSVEALDELEAQLEVMHDLAHLERVVSEHAAKGPAAPALPKTADKRTQPRSAKPASRISAATVGGRTVGRNATVRHSIAAPPTKQTEHNAATQAAANKRLSVASRPASLAPPKPLARSSKPPTVSTFELPGEAVAQRLKEKRLARLSMSMPPSTQTPGRTASPTKPKTVTSTKPPTRPQFELPGEAISRRKREEREAKLKAEQEEERKRREFRARPVRASVVAGGTFPRQTAASRARMSLKASAAAEAAAVAPRTTPSTAKRHSTIGAGMSSRPSLAVSTGTASLSRGRTSATLTPSTAGLSRATSTSTGSIRGSGSGSTPSAEEVRAQKLRGKEIFKRESSFVSEKERERHSREEAAKKAREEAAERSKLAARAWAEKQKAKKAANGPVGV